MDGKSKSLLDELKRPAIQATGFSTPGFDLTATGDLTRTPGAQSVVSGLGEARTRAGGRLEDLQQTLRPGFSGLRKARLGAVENARRRAVGNLRENLNRRRVLGSSFAGAALSQTEREFGQAAAEEEGRSFLEETAANQQLIQQRLGTEMTTIQAELDQFNQEAALAGNVSAQELQVATANAQLAQEAAQFNAQLEAQEAAGTGQLIGTIAGGAAGFFLGGPAGALAGASIGGGGGVGTTDLSQIGQ